MWSYVEQAWLVGLWLLSALIPSKSPLGWQGLEFHALS